MTDHSGDRVGQQLGNYRLIRPLGSGGFAEVYLGEHIYLKTQAAIKVLKMQMVDEDLQDFLREAQTIAHLDHSNIVRVLDFGVQTSIPFLVMHYAPNGSLRSLYKGPVSLATILPSAQAIAAALDYAHEQKIVHRDVKPDNMLLGRNSEVLLSDFGIAVVTHATGVQRTQDAMGTPAYMAPEQLQGKPQPASDQYALAVAVYEWLCGRRPFDGDTHALGYQHIHIPPPSLRNHVASIPSAVEHVVLRALAKDASQRFESATAFSEALEQAGQPSLQSVVLPAREPGQRDMAQAPACENISGAQQDKIRAVHARDEQECFLCLFTQVRSHAEKYTPCVEKKIQGHLLFAQERTVNGKSTPCIMIDLGTKLALIALDTDYYREFVRDVIVRGKTVRRLPITIYHLPAPTTITEYKGKPLYHYIAYPHTLAVLESDTLLNITDLSQADYCNRKYLLGRLVSSPSSMAAIRGNLIHHCFTGLLKKNDRSNSVSEAREQKTSLEILRHLFEEALALSSMEMALANVSADAMRTDVLPHLESLATWYEGNRVTLWGSNDSENTVRAETFLLVPEIGLRGRLDLYWQQTMSQSLLELKTGGSTGDLPKSDHRRQVYGYQALLAVRQNSKMKKAEARLLYSGTPGQASDFPIRFTVRDLQRVNSMRNILILSHVTGVPPAPPAPARCTKCSMLDSCERVSSLLGWQPPQPKIDIASEDMDVPIVETEKAPIPLLNVRRKQVDTAEDREFFAKYYKLLHLEGKAGYEELAALWKTTVEERVASGKTIAYMRFLGAVAVNDGWEQTFSCDNQSELREGDEILLSNGDPISGEIVTGTIVKISAKEVVTWTRERIDNPTQVDRYGNDLVHVRTLQNLLRWLETELHMRDLVAGRVRPRFVGVDVAHHPDFNKDQNKAVERAVQMQDYLLIQGPPGTGKTSVIAEIVKRLTQQGQRVLLAAFTNQAVDNMLKRLNSKGFHDYVRLGNERSVDAEVQMRLLKKLVEEYSNEPQEEQEESSPDSHQFNIVQNILQTMPVVASTTATWSSDKYLPQAPDNHEASLMYFDVAIIDEASQLTIPAILGALRFVKRFILVGDDKQLPPLVLSKEAAKQGLVDSLFTFLQALDAQYTEKHQEVVKACVSLKTQYRMNKWISNFSSTVFYEKTLVPHESVANQRLEFQATAVSDLTRKRKEAVAQEPFSVTRAIAPEFPLVFLDVRGEQDNGALKASNAEAVVVRTIVKGLLERGIEPRDIGIIAPYRAQVANIRRQLFTSGAAQGWDGLSIDTPLSVDTVDRFQGGERKVIVISFATTCEPEANSPRREFLTNSNRLNVALTRAKHKLILIGCAPALEPLPIFNRLIAYCHSMKTLIAYEEQIEHVAL